MTKPHLDGTTNKAPRSPGWVRRTLPWIKPHWKAATAAFGASAIGMAVTAYTPLVLRSAIDDGIVAKSKSLTPYLVVLLVIAVVRFVTAFVRRWLGGKFSLDFEYDMRNEIYDHLQRLDFARHDELETGQIVSRANTDLRILQFLYQWLPLVLGSFLMFAVALVLMLSVSWELTLVSLVALPPVMWLALRLRTWIFAASYDNQEKLGVVANVVDEAVAGVQVVKGFGQERREIMRLDDAAQDVFGSRMRTVRIQARYLAAIQSIPAFGAVGVLAYAGWRISSGAMSVGTLLAFTAWLVMILAPVRMIVMLIALGQRARAGAERVFELLDSTPEVKEQPGATELEVPSGEVTLDHVSFGYLRSEPVLDDFTLTINPGETVAFVGASGSGKSTIAALLPRFYDIQSGSIRIDGSDIRDVTLESLRRQIGIVFEDTFLFSMTIGENVAFGHPDATSEQIEAVARTAGIHDFIASLPDGYDAMVGEKGLTLSGGQRQRIAIARALLRNPKILILDDATSSVDITTEEAIHRSLKEVLSGRTTIIVAHRKSTVALADRVVLVEEGKVCATGTSDELLETSESYRRLMDENLGATEKDQGAGGFAAVLANPQEAKEMLGRVVRTVASAGEGSGGGMGGAAAGMGGAAAGGGGAGMREGRPGAQVGIGGVGQIVAGLNMTPELRAKIDALPPATDIPDADRETAIERPEAMSFRAVIAPFRFPLVIGMILVAADALLTLAGPRLVGSGADAASSGDPSRLWRVVTIYLAVVLIDWWVMWAQTRWVGRTGENLLYAMRLRVFAHLQRLGLDFYDKEMAGRIMTRMTSDIDALASLLQEGLINLIINLFTLVGVAVLLFFMNWRLALVTMTVVPPLIGVAIWFRRASDKAYERIREKIAEVLAHLQESISGVRVSQAFTREGINQVEFRRIAAEHLDARLDGNRISAIFFPFVEFLGVVGTALVLGAGAHFYSAGTLSSGELLAFVLLLTSFFAPIQQLSQIFDTYQQAKAAMAKLTELIETDSSTPEDPEAGEAGEIGGVKLNDIHFSYGGGEVLNGVDLEIVPGETVALVGPTGAGKSTIMKLVARFYDPKSGSITLDGCDLRDLRISSYRSRLGLVPQDGYLFTGTIAYNIAYARPDAPAAEIMAAARAVGADGFIESLPDRYETFVTQEGRSLSAGERQLIALARAWLADPDLLLLDEATSNLDLATEARVQKAMGLLASGRTTLLIAHRLPTARRSTRIAVLDAGKIVEFGTHDELVEQGGIWADMWEQWRRGPGASADMLSQPTPSEPLRRPPT